MAKGIAKAMTNFAGDVWKGMSKGVDAGKTFRVNGGKQSINAIKNMQKNKPKLKSSAGGYKPSRVSNMKGKPNVKQVDKATFGQKAGNWVGGGIRDSYNNISKKDMGVMKGIKEGHKGADGKMSVAKMSGTFVGVSAAGRIATGGGVTKDKNGNTNLIGIPFI